MMSDKLKLRSNQFLESCALAMSFCSILASAAYALVEAWHWPLVGDAALMHYVVFLIHAGYAPYSQIIDVNLPGSYAFDAVAMKLFGNGPVGLRLYDGILCLVVLGCSVALSTRNWYSQLCGGAAALVFLLIHLRDGVVQAGQRDLAMAVIVAVAYVVFLKRPLCVSIGRIIGFELLIGLTLTIKPTLFPLAALPFVAPYIQRTEYELKMRDYVLGLCSLLLPMLVMTLWLERLHSLGAFLHVMRTVDRQHSQLAHKTLVFLLGHSIAPIGALAGWCLILARFSKLRWEEETKLLLYGVACGLLSIVWQGKGFSYQRYPFLLLVIIMIFKVLARGLSGRSMERSFSALTICVIGLGLSPAFARTVGSYDSFAPFQDALSKDLASMNAGQSEVQCLDTVGGCLSTLNELKVVQSTGFLYDCYAYAGSDQQKREYREAFMNALLKARPRYIVLSSEVCLDSQGNIDRIEAWPALHEFLSSNYEITREWQPRRYLHWWNQKEQPPSYRIFALDHSLPSSRPR